MENPLVKIKSVLISQKIQTTPQNILKACIEAILKLKSKNNSHSQIKILFDVIIQLRYFEINKMTLEVISECISEFTNEIVTILKFYFLSSPPDNNRFDIHNQLFSILIKNTKSQSISNLIVKNYNMKEYFDSCNLNEQINLLINSFSILGDKIDMIKFLDNEINPLEMDKLIMNKLILSFLEYQYEIDGSIEITVIKDIIENKISLECNYKMVRILTLLLFFYKKSTRITKNSTVASQKLLSLIKFEILENNSNSEESLIQLVSYLSEILLPTFTTLFIDLNEKFLKSDDKKYTNILRNLISYIKIEEFIAIVENIDISKHYILFKGLSNMDISVFIDLYTNELNECLNGCTNESANGCTSTTNVSKSNSKLDHVLSLLPSFSYYSTDYYNKSHDFIKILKSHLKTHPSIVSLSIEKLIQSHRNNLESELKINNPIEKEDSKRILKLIISEGFLYDLIELYFESKGNEFDSSLDLLIEINIKNNNSIINGIVNDLINTIINTTNNQNIYNALRLLSFFVKYLSFDFDFISRLIELCSMESEIQKKSYFLLYNIYNQKRTDVCICEILYTSLKRTVNSSALRNRLLLEYSIIKNGCRNDGCRNECNNNSNSNSNKNGFHSFINEIINNVISGNIKYKKAVKEIFKEITDDQIINYLIINLNSNDTNTILGCIELIRIILFENMNQGIFIKTAIDAILKIGFHSLKVSKQIIRIFIELIKINYNDEINYNEILKMVDSYINQFSKKMNSQLREFCILAERKNLLTKNMKSFLKFKNRSGKNKEIKILEKREFKDLL